MITSTTSQTNADFKPDLTPLLDIIFIVMVFLLLTASINIQTLEIDIPTTNEERVLSDVESDVIAINIHPNAPHWAINGDQFEQWDTFTNTLLAKIEAEPETPVILGADGTAHVQLMMQMLTFMQKNNLSQTQIIMEEAN
ncbi:ExbD/TolR family protein [Thaumasiovibrio sp. DFM-14]|uniref:ExbD/TolR family protein n=1 Tax=Thaumasiovibrio sp. DFM-14 TaxID=3384792 RepID=UPI0039A3ECEC